MNFMFCNAKLAFVTPSLDDLLQFFKSNLMRDVNSRHLIISPESVVIFPENINSLLWHTNCRSSSVLLLSGRLFRGCYDFFMIVQRPHRPSPKAKRRERFFNCFSRPFIN